MLVEIITDPKEVVERQRRARYEYTLLMMESGNRLPSEQTLDRWWPLTKEEEK